MNAADRLAASSESSPVRGRQPVEAALVKAAGDLLADVGARAMSVRDVARLAGVNHGQVHHYFGSKEALIRAAMKELAADHFRRAMQRAGSDDVPPALSLAADERYWKAVIRLSIEGDLDIARIEVDEGVSVPQHALGVLARRRGLDAPDLEAKAIIAASAALQLGWVALEEFLFLIADVTPDEQAAVRARARHIAAALFDAGSDTQAG